MIRPQDLLCPRPEGLYCPPGDFYVDPARPVDRAVVTHGHSDHARAGHGAVLATPETLDIMAERYGQGFAAQVQAAPYGEPAERDGVEVTLVPAGHVLGSAQAVVRWKGLTIVVSGDYKRRRDPTCPPFEPVPCDVFISEATFGLPVFRHPTHWEEIATLPAALAGKNDPLTGAQAYGFLDPLKYQWGGFGFYFLGDRAAAYAKHPDDPAWLFDPETMKPRVNNPGWVQAIQDVLDLVKANAYPPDQLNADPNTTAFSQFLGGTGAALCWWGDVGSNARTSDTSVVGDVVGFSINPGANKVYNSKTAAWEEKENFAPNLAYLGWGVYVTSRVSGDEKKRKAAWSAAAHLGGKDISLWMAAYPSGFQPYRNSQFQYDEWVAAGYDRDFVEDYLGSNLDSYNHPNGAIEPRIPGIFQYYSIAEDELVKGINGQYASAQETADAIAAAWEKITDQIGRDSQIKLYKASLGM